MNSGIKSKNSSSDRSSPEDEFKETDAMFEDDIKPIP